MRGSIAITGMGVVTAQGIGVAKTWQGVVASKDILRPWDNLPANHALAKLAVAQCPQLPPPPDLPPRFWSRLSRTQQLACIAVDEALEQARLPHRFNNDFGPVGLFLATTICGMDLNERFYARYRQNRDSAPDDLMRRLQPYEVGALIARRHRIGNGPGLRGVFLTTCVGSAMAIGAAVDAIQAGECDLALAGGSEALCQVVLSGFHSLKVVAPDGCRPFDRGRTGITVGEGAGIVVLESLESAQRRGATPLAYIRGVGISCDAHHITAPDPGGIQPARAICEALRRGSIEPAQVDYINAHGTGTRDNDAMETIAIRRVFAPSTTSSTENFPIVSSTKRFTGHTFGAAGVIEAILCVQAIREDLAPMNGGSKDPDPSLDLPIVRGQNLSSRVDVALSTNFAFGGNNTAVVITRAAGESPDAPIPARRSCTELVVHGLGVVTDLHPSLASLRPHDPEVCPAPLNQSQIPDSLAFSEHDSLAQLALHAAEQAWTMAGMSGSDREQASIVFVSEWGTIDSTVACLDSMLDAGGRFPSPRHFVRSVYSSVASLMAIHFGIHGPCQTLCFDEAPIVGGLCAAQRLLHARRCDRVLLVWAEQAAEIAVDLARRAVEKLGRKEFQRYIDRPLGYGATALVVGRNEASGLGVHCAVRTVPARALRSVLYPDSGEEHPFATDCALEVARAILSARMDGLPGCVRQSTRQGDTFEIHVASAENRENK